MKEKKSQVLGPIKHKSMEQIEYLQNLSAVRGKWEKEDLVLLQSRM